jgi:hypothetical protein
VKAVFYTGEYKNLSPYIRHLSSGLSNFRCKRSEQNGVQHATVQRTSVQGRLHVSDGRKRNYLYECTVKPSDISIAKNASVKCL